MAYTLQEALNKEESTLPLYFDDIAARSGLSSIAVDDEGFIYVADVLNQRIQKFSP